jgi:hypothetical protein
MAYSPVVVITEIQLEEKTYIGNLNVLKPLLQVG